MADCEKCALKCTDEIKIAKHYKGRMPMGNCIDFTPKQTNADRIRAMSDEELKEFLNPRGFCHIIESCPYLENEEVNCDNCIMKWLQSEVEE